MESFTLEQRPTYVILSLTRSCGHPESLAFLEPEPARAAAHDLAQRVCNRCYRAQMRTAYTGASTL